ncbi:hypothetical protein IQ07DRAFT_596465 [Pyrenochaeta sp. DS3sAY3a]|nr:hypothetical protein IQ07DRAFT_596465 [Pyrenochaeta sp. DS3sAY3a]
MSSSTATKNVSAAYCAVDIQHTALTHRISELALANPSFQVGRHHENPARRNGKIALRGVCGTYQDALGVLEKDLLIRDTPQFHREGEATTQKKCLLWLSSSISNATPADAAIALRTFAGEAILRRGDTILVGLDRCRNANKVQAAYSEQSPCWKEYIRNGIRNAGAAVGLEATQYLDGGDNWDYISYSIPEEGRHMEWSNDDGDCSVYLLERRTSGTNAPVNIQ